MEVLLATKRFTHLRQPLVMIAAVVVVLGSVLVFTHAATNSTVGDINHDGVVNVFDLSILFTKWGTSDAASDLNHDGIVNIFDASLLLDHWGQTAATPSASASPSPTGAGAVSAADLAAARAMLTNETLNGWRDCDYNSGGNNYSYHGVKVNWNSVYFNFNGEAHPDPDPCNQTTIGGRYDLTVPATCWTNPSQSNCQRHEDRLTALRFLHALLLYQQDGGNPDLGGVSLSAEIAKVSPHVQQLFATTDPRGWSYFEFADIARLSGGTASPFAQLAGDTLRAFDNSDGTAQGRPDWQIEQAADLAGAGSSPYLTAAEKTKFAADGQARLNTYWAANFVPLVDGTGQPSGAAINTNAGSGGVRPIKAAEQADMANALAQAGITDKAKLLRAGLRLFLLPSGGYSQGCDDILNGVPVNISTKTTAGRSMSVMLLDKTLGNSQDIANLDATFHNSIFLHGSNFPGPQLVPNGYEGVVYEQRSDLSLYTLTMKDSLQPQPGAGQSVTEDWVTSEAMGIAMVALLSE
jgi:hypothetical protein